MSATQNYASTPRRAIATISTANPNRDGTGTIGNVLTAGASGSRIESINIQAVASTTPGMVRLFSFDGVNTKLEGEIQIAGVTPGATTPAYSAQLTTANLSAIMPIILPAGWSLRASTQNAESFNIIASGGDF